MLLLCILGGLLGWGIHLARPPIYEAKAIFTVNINYNQPDVLDKIDDDHYAEDLMIVALMGAIQSADVINQVIADAAEQEIDFADFKLGKRLFVERKTSYIELIVRDENPESALSVANLWADTALDYLEEAQVHALRTYTLSHEIKSLADCINLVPGNTGDICMNLTLAELDERLQKTEIELASEVQASRGLVPAILFNLSHRATLPDAPAAYSAEIILLAGVFLGFLAGLLVLQIGKKGV